MHVSILIPCYNAAPFIATTVSSALAQSYERIEVIVVDDGSTDSSMEQISHLNDPRLKIIRQDNAGHSAAANAAFEASSGDYIKFFDADDYLSPDHVEIQVARLEDNQQSVAMGEWARFYTDDPQDAEFAPRDMYRDAPPVDWLTSEWMDARPMTQCGAFLIPRQVLEESGGWDEELTLIDDFEFFARMLLKADKIVFTPRAKLHYRSGVSGSLSGRKSRSAVVSAYKSLLKGTNHLLNAKNSEQTRLAAANLLQDFIFTYFPDHADLRQKMQARIAELGGSDVEPDGPPGFHKLRRIVGWKLARRIQRALGR